MLYRYSKYTIIYLFYLIKDVPDSWKTWSSIEHFHQNAAYSPNIQRRRVVGRAQKNIWRSVP